MQDYYTIEEKAAHWNISIRHIQYLCRQNKIDGAIKRAGVWFIPSGTPNPAKNTKSSSKNQDRVFVFAGTKKLIFDSAIDLFLAKGVANTTFKDISKNIGIRQTTMYHHFKSKQEILDTIYDYYCYYYIKERISLDEMISLAQKENPETIFEYIIYEFKEEQREKILEISMIIMQRISIDERAKEIARTLILSDGINYVEAILNSAVEAGRFAPFDTQIMSVFINIVRIFTLYYWIIEPSTEKRNMLSEYEHSLYNYALKFIVDLRSPENKPLINLY